MAGKSIDQLLALQGGAAIKLFRARNRQVSTLLDYYRHAHRLTAESEALHQAARAHEAQAQHNTAGNSPIVAEFG